MPPRVGSLIDYIVENALIPQAFLLIGVWGTVLYLVLSHQEVPSWLQDSALAILGYFFHVVTSAQKTQ